MAQYLMIFDDQSCKQFESYHADDERSVAHGYLDIIRFEGGTFQRLVIVDAEKNHTAWEAI